MDASLSPPAPDPIDVHQKIGILTRQLHDTLNELGYTDQLRGTMGELPDAQSRLSYIARLTGEAAEKVLGRVEQAKVQHDHLAAETRRVTTALVQDPVRAVASGEIMNFLSDVGQVAKATDEHLTEIMMAQDFHDLTGQVIARVVTLAATIEQQLVQLVIQTAPTPVAAAPAEAPRAHLAGPVVNPEKTADVVTDQSQVDDLLASLGF
ncbi:chemotaxis protein CheZ [Acidovorax sp. SRB_14]|uniref:protein phosphatase CheZ n=1 Tax=unclassified Acidovorax TaxID=2684926 RepID=UPI00145F9D92|nr:MULTISPECIES: protein phosphatase CheZ [unclassified Acidovorax]NMM77238.1 chemotaxis protein CheZ [Acidovorax sp. SRB_24]NMM82235.1 chemotaxis protein CheZ [Acidovorax sp. SRB_14]NMM85413.1 chemotaxis protein CheZ [Rhodococcus sp. SRB_17]